MDGLIVTEANLAFRRLVGLPRRSLSQNPLRFVEKDYASS